MRSAARRALAIGAAPLITALTIATTGAPAHAAGGDATCAARVTISYSPPVTQPVPPASGPQTTITGSGSITACAVTDGGATTGTFAYQLTVSSLTCTSAGSGTGTLTISWADGTSSDATLANLLPAAGAIGGVGAISGTVTAGRFTSDTATIATLRSPLALATCLSTGLSQATGTVSLTFTQPLT